MRVLVTGAQGFIGAHVAAVLAADDHEVVPAVRTPAQAATRPGAILCDFARDHASADWLPRLRGIDAVVNCAGILREDGRGSFDAVHRAAPAALFAACAEAGIAKVVQISALGDPADGAFLASKHAGDAALMAIDLDWVVLRPSLVWAAGGSYGGTSLIRAMAALPLVLPLAGDGRQELQPITVEDLAHVVLGIVNNEQASRLLLEAVGPETVSFAGFLADLRTWLGYPRARNPHLPMVLVKGLCAIGDRVIRGPLGGTMLAMLERGNVGQPGAYRRLCKAAHHHPASPTRVFAETPAQVQDRWHARLYFLRPFLRLTIALLWIVSGLVGFLFPIAETIAMMEDLGIGETFAVTIAHCAAGIDVLLGLALLFRFKVIPVAWLMLASVLAYTLFLGIADPALWLHPFGPLVKNAVLVPALLVMMALEDPR